MVVVVSDGWFCLGAFIFSLSIREMCSHLGRFSNVRTFRHRRFTGDEPRRYLVTCFKCHSKDNASRHPLNPSVKKRTLHDLDLRVYLAPPVISPLCCLSRRFRFFCGAYVRVAIVGSHEAVHDTHPFSFFVSFSMCSRFFFGIMQPRSES